MQGSSGNRRLGLAAFCFHIAATLLAVLAAGRVAQAQENLVDLELVLAVDASRSMDYDEQIIQRDGYVAAFRSEEVITAILGGGVGRIAVTYLVWAGEHITRVEVPWSLIDSKESAHAFAARLAELRPQRLSRTSISGALTRSQELFGTSSWRGIRRVVDVSGDGPNNQGLPIEPTRDALVNQGIVINGLPLLVRTSTFGFGIENLDEYYTDCVIGGTGAFVIPVRDWADFPQAVRRKLVLEIAGRFPKVVPAGFRLAQAEGRPKVDCLIGEKLWQERMRDMEWR